MSIRVAGQGTDFATDPNIVILNLLKDNWPAGGAAGDTELQIHSVSNPTGVKIATGWWDGNPYYQIHVRPTDHDVQTQVLGANRWRYHDRHDVHIFAKGNNAKDKRWKLEKEVLQQLHLKENAPGTGLSWMQVDGPQELPEEDARSEVAHSVVRVTLYYHKVRV